MIKNKNKNIIIISVFSSILIILLSIIVSKKCLKFSREVAIHPEIKRMMEYLNLDNCIITELNGVNEIQQIHITNEEVDQREINNYINDTLKMKTSFQADPMKKQIKGNECVQCAIIKYEGDKKIYSNDNEYIIMDSEQSSVISKALLGKNIGETLEMFEDIDGKRYHYYINIKSIGEMETPILTDAFVRQYYDADSTSEYLEKLEKSLTTEHTNSSFLQAQNNILQDLVDKSKFDLDKKQVTDYSMKVVNSYVNEAYLYNKDLKTYYTENLNMSESEFFDNCYKQGENYVKRMLVVGALSKSKNCFINENEVLKSFNLQECSDDEAYTYMEYQYLTEAITSPYITIDNEE